MSDVPGRSSRFRVGRTLAELATIVVGVLIALGVDAWYDGTQDRAAERVYLSQLLEDLAETERQMTEDDPRNDLTRHRGFLNAFQAPSRPSADSTLLLFRGVNGYSNPVPLLAVAEALVSTGDFSLVDPAIRAAIIRWESRARDYELIPLYGREQLFAEKYYALLGRVGEPAASGAANDSIFVRIPDGSDLRHLYEDATAYALAADLYHLKRYFERYRNRQVEWARALRLQVEEYLGDR